MNCTMNVQVSQSLIVVTEVVWSLSRTWVLTLWHSDTLPIYCVQKETVNETGIDLLSSEVSPHSVAMFILTPANIILDSGTSEYMR
jgi:hypothetical protein